MVRALLSHGRGHEFESRTAHQLFLAEDAEKVLQPTGKSLISQKVSNSRTFIVFIFSRKVTVYWKAIL